MDNTSVPLELKEKSTRFDLELEQFYSRILLALVMIVIP